MNGQTGEECAEPTTATATNYTGDDDAGEFRGRGSYILILSKTISFNVFRVCCEIMFPWGGWVNGE